MYSYLNYKWQMAHYYYEHYGPHGHNGGGYAAVISKTVIALQILPLNDPEGSEHNYVGIALYRLLNCLPVCQSVP